MLSKSRLFPAFVFIIFLVIGSVQAAPRRTNAATTRPECAKGQLPVYNDQGFSDVELCGGRWLTNVYQPPLGEPINFIISANSDHEVLSSKGLEDYFLSLNFSIDPFALGGHQAANLGDGNGYVNQTNLFREDFGEAGNFYNQSINGGNHFRVFPQNGPFVQFKKNRAPWFCAASITESLDLNHTISVNGYNRGRNNIIGRATRHGVTISPSRKKYSTKVERGHFYANTAYHIRHNIPADGNVAIFTVKYEGKEEKKKHHSGSMA